MEHHDPAVYQKEGGEKALFGLLDQRFPQKEVTDEMSKSLTEIFNLRAAEESPSRHGSAGRLNFLTLHLIQCS